MEVNNEANTRQRPPDGQGTSPKLHHYVPQGYLRGFATDQGRVTAVPLDRGRKPFTASVKNVAAQTHFHRIAGLDAPDEFEKVLSAAEGEAFKILRKLDEGVLPLAEADRWTFSHYMALQAVRGPDTRATMQQLRAKMIRLEVGAGGRRNVSSWIKKNLGFDPSEEQAERIWEQATRPEGPPITFSAAEHIEHMVNSAEHLTPYFATRPWLLVRFNRRALLTSDAPVNLIRSERAEPWEGVGYATARGITFPLTRRLGLLMTDPMAALERMNADDARVQKVRAAVLRGEADRTEVGTTAMEKLFNDHTAGGACEYIYHHPDDASFVPAELPEPNLITMDMQGLNEMEFTGEPWFPGATAPADSP